MAKIDWKGLWFSAKMNLVPEARTPLRIFKSWVELCAGYFVFRHRNHFVLRELFNWMEFNVTRKWKFKPCLKRQTSNN